MSLRKIKQPETLIGSPVSIYFDSEYGEYQVKIAGKPAATYFTDDKKDALGTAQHMRNNLPIKKLATRVKKNPAKKNPIVTGITARPITGKRKPVFAVEYAKSKSGPWTTAGIFPNRTLADDYCKSMHDQNGGKWWRVVLK